LIKKWKSDNKLTEFINYDKLEEYLDFGGIRIEDDVLITAEGYKVLGNSIPKTVEEVEKLMNK
jgi:Xaa-Pro aminopeptidase